MFTKIFRTLGPITFAATVLTLIAPSTLVGQITSQTAPSQVTNRIIQPIDEHALVTLKGNVRKDLAAAQDLGPVEDGMQLHLFLLLQRSTMQQADLDNFLARQQQPNAPEYHKWLTPKQFGARFGASPEDIAKLSAWLESHGFQVRGVLNNASMIDFAATAGQVREAFHTELHYFSIRGGKHAANLQDPQIPAALAPVVAGIKGLSKIPAHANHTRVRQSSYDAETHRWHVADATGTRGPSPEFDDGAPYYFVTPQDLYTIYDVNPAFSGGELAAKSTVAVIEESDIEYGTVNGTTGAATGGDVATFRSLFGVPGTLNMHVYHGFGTVACSAPGIDPDGNGEDEEASLDAEWINATAPSANVVFMSCDQSPDNGIFSSMAALIDNSLSDVMSLSYGESELDYNSSDYTFQDSLFAQAATQGQSIFISSGDSGSDSADQNTNGTATSGINVSAFAAPTVTVTGGTDFSDYYDAVEGGPAQSTYWSSTNSTFYGDALSYIPETAWNDSCASSIYANALGYTGAGECGASGAGGVDGSVVGGSGGFSTHYGVPAWQMGISGYLGSFHSLPDIAGFAASGFWGHVLIFCDSNPTYGVGYDCSSSGNFGLAGGTSFVAPYMAGVAGLLVDYTGSRQGLLNPALYALAKAQFTASGTATACYSDGQASNTGVTSGLPAAACIFNDVTTSNNDVPCQSGSTSCFVNSGDTYGMLSLTGSSSLTVAYPSTPGFDQVTGIGTVNVHNLLTNWNTAFTSTTTLTASPTSITSSGSTELTATVTGGKPTGYVDTPPALTGTASFKAGTTSLGNCTLSSGTCSLSVPASALQAGANSVTATFLGSGTYPTSTSSVVTVTVTAASSFALSASPTTLSLTPGATTGNTSTVSVTPSNGFTGNVALTCAVVGPVGATSPATCSLNPATPDVTGTTAVTSTLTAATTATTTPGTYTITTTGTQGAITSTATVTLVVNKTTPTLSMFCSPNPVAYQQQLTCSSTVSGDFGGTIAFTINGNAWTSGAPNSSGTFSATRTVHASSGSFVITANYSGDANYAATSASVTVTAEPATPTLSINCSPNPVAYQQQLTCSSTVSGDFGGTIAFTINGNPWTSGAPNGSGTFSAIRPPVHVSSGSFLIAANYSGDTNYAATSASVTVTATPATPTLSINCTPNPVAYQQQLTCSSTVSGDFGGTISFTINGNAWTSGAPNGSGTFSATRTVNVSSGSYVIAANYSGDTNYAETSASVTVTAMP